ncbi:hypothetical protein [Nakamurella deserti]|uniref:hypothetical protein n=1 Tax=Nakamurella deserti TaxID=2164074 RepID=UPI000DBE6554|nr:hypothetical protein [Nakamurella deserti]
MSAGIRSASIPEVRPESPAHHSTLVGRSLHALALGVAIGGVVGMVADPRGRYVLAFVVGFVLWLLLTLVRTVAAVRATSPAPVGRGTAAPAEAALARVESLRRTGLELNGQPQCDLLLVVSPPPGHGAAYATTTRAILDVVTLADHRPGAVVVVARPDPARPDVRLIAEPPADLAAAARAEARLEPGEGTIPPLDRVPVRESTRTTATGFRAPTAGSLLWALLLTAGAAGAVLLPTLIG